MMWTIADYRPNSLFSLRPSNATTSGGKTLLTPTPFSIKMALLDVAIRVYGRQQGVAWFPYLRDLQIAITLPSHLSVAKTFIKILRPHKKGLKDSFGTGLQGSMGNTIAYREMVFYAGVVRIGIQPHQSATVPLEALLAQIHYLGKRGGFMQFVGVTKTEVLPTSFTRLNQPEGEPFVLGGTLQLLDDCGPKMTFDHADVFSGKRLAVGKDNGRLLRPVILPYTPIQDNRSYTLYERV